MSTATVLWSLLRGARGESHGERLESFYHTQAAAYDRFRARLLHGREDLIAALHLPTAARVAEFGGGTGHSLECLGDARIRACASYDLIDLCPSLLQVARDRVVDHDWQQVVRLRHADVTDWRATAPLDAVLCSYSLSMVPDWFAAVDNAVAQLKPGGLLAVVDFYISRKHPAAGRTRHGRFTRHFWPAWFGHDGVHLRSDLLPYLESRCPAVHLEERRGPVPFLMGLKVPYLVYVGRKPATTAT
jgi:S-adenosylmethionine-diacylgycerolhomoserine-N-methlytransferase